MTDMHPDWIKEKMQAMRETIEALEAERDKLKADLTEALLQSLSDQGQAQDAYEAQRNAEAKRDALQEVINQMRAIVEAD